MTTETIPTETATETGYTGATPWAAQGIRLENVNTAAEAIQAAHLDWEVQGFMDLEQCGLARYQR